ncbi:GAF domain-containing protein [Natrinema versiforme]|uniref:histidine kinase n=1 Tax=Natrinema versiforme TaxID=88724 RepID=A0A4V6MBE9_9EURY|nr:GAF domain-containing protein [Natrinema versiforme]QCS40829.1 PAS domain-containing protein [Natrinema versiforme]
MNGDGTTTTPANPRPRTVLYVAGSESAASDGAAQLEAHPSGPKRSVHAITAVERVRSWAPEADCVVFAETPTTAAGSALLEVVDACGATPVILFTESSFAPTAARSTGGIDGYVRRDTDDAVAHLADEIEWVCRGENGATADADTETEPETDSEDDVIAMGGERAPSTGDPADSTGPAARLLESVPELVACRDRDRLFELLVESAADALERESCWLSTVHFGEFTPRATAPTVSEADLEPLSREGPLGEALRTGEVLRIDDITADDRLPTPLEGIASLCCVPVGDVGILQIAAAEQAAFDEGDCDLLATWCRGAAAVLERIDADASHDTARERLRRERDRLRTERDRIATERDRLRTLFANVPEPAVRYEIDDGRPIVRTVNDTFADVFGTDPEAIVGAPVDEDTVPPGLEARRATLLESLRAGERRQFVSRRVTDDGVREFLLTLVPVEAGASGDAATDENGAERTPDHNPEGLIVYSDVTEANRREREAAAAEARLETIAELVDDDIRTPLNVARGYLELAAETGDPEHFAEVDDAQERLRELVDQLVAIARRDDVLVETEPVAVHDVARRAWVAVDTGDARLVTRAANDRVLEADKARLRELFEHLLQAVVDGAEEDADAEIGAGDAGDGAPVVTVGATEDGFYVARRTPDGDAATVDDGLETNAVPGRLAAADGTGFGLGTVERIADAHGWSVGVAEDDDRVAFAFRGVNGGGGDAAAKSDR